MFRIKKPLFLTVFAAFLAIPTKADFYAQVGDTFQRDGCVIVLVHIYEDQGTETYEDDKHIGSGGLSFGNCDPQGMKPLNDSLGPKNREVFDLELSPVPVTGNSLEVDYLGKNYTGGVIKNIQNPDVMIKLEEQGLDFEGKEQIDLSGLPSGYYFILVGNEEGEKAVKQFKIE